MQLFKNELLRDTGPTGHDLAFGVPLFGPRYGRSRAFTRPARSRHDVDALTLARSINAEPPPAYPPLHLARL